MDLDGLGSGRCAVVPLGCGAWGGGRVFGVEGVQGGFAVEAIGLWLAEEFDVANKLTV